jgi:ABC-type nitrate/sulfonate/bicarbonate transport system permease component
MERQSSRNLRTYAGAAGMLVLWALAALLVNTFAHKPFPYPWESAVAVTTDPGILLHIGYSISRWAAGYLIAVMIGISTGILMAKSTVFDDLVSPLVHTLQLVPGLAWIPIALILFGIGNTSAVFMIAVTALSPVIINTRAGLLQIDPNLIRAARMMELSVTHTFLHVSLAGAAPSIISGLRTGSANAFRVLISAEMVLGSNFGLGYSLIQARWSFDYAQAFGTVIVIVLIGLVLEKLVFTPIERHISRKRGML